MPLTDERALQSWGNHDQLQDGFFDTFDGFTELFDLLIVWSQLGRVKMVGLLLFTKSVFGLN